MGLSQVHCPICGADAPPFARYHAIDRTHELEVSLFAARAVHRCPHCGHGFCPDPPSEDDLREYYASFWYRAADRASRRLTPTSAKRAASSLLTWTRDRITNGTDPRARDQLSFPPLKAWLSRAAGGRLRTLEIGAGPAGLSRALKALPDVHVTAEVIEPGGDYDLLYRLSRIRKVSDTLEKAGAGSAYDLVHASHVLEHFGDARSALANMIDLLGIGGALFIEVPNTEEPYWQYRHYPDPPHLQFFTPASMQALLTHSALEPHMILTSGREIVSEAEVGYLRRDTPQLLSPSELAALAEERRRRMAVVVDGEQLTVDSPSGREFIRALAVRKA